MSGRKTISEIRAAIVGCGRIAGLHQLGYRGRQDARIVAVCDPKAGRARQAAKEWGVEKVYTDYSRVLADPEVNLVELLVPHHLHAEMTVLACQAGKHVSVQKPMAMNVLEAQQMVLAAEHAGVVLRVYENFVFYPPNVVARQMIQAGEIGEPQMIRLHVGTGRSQTQWKVPLDAWTWRFRSESASGGVLVFDHGYHLFSLAYDLMGPVERVVAWIDHSPVGSGVPKSLAAVDAPTTMMFQFKAGRRYGVMDFVHTPEMVMDSIYYADDDRVEVIGDRGILMINRCTARTVDLPPLMLFRDGVTRPIPVERYEWHDSFIDCTQHLFGVLKGEGEPVLDGKTGKAVLQFVVAAHLSARQGVEVRPDEVDR
jgi:predicted dehydrogenase